jgi:hypothetical protein
MVPSLRLFRILPTFKEPVPILRAADDFEPSDLLEQSWILFAKPPGNILVNISAITSS